MYAVKGLAKVVHDYRKAAKERRFLEENRWRDLLPGDLVAINGTTYMYMELDEKGSPGGIGPEPVFTKPVPELPPTLFYIREDAALLAAYEHVFGEGQVQIGFNGNKIGWINSSEYRKVGHIARDQWRAMLIEVKRELSGTK